MTAEHGHLVAMAQGFIGLGVRCRRLGPIQIKLLPGAAGGPLSVVDQHWFVFGHCSRRPHAMRATDGAPLPTSKRAALSRAKYVLRREWNCIEAGHPLTVTAEGRRLAERLTPVVFELLRIEPAGHQTPRGGPADDA